MDIVTKLQKNRGRILQIVGEHGAQNARIFGSLARGEATAQSDLDLLISLKPGRSLLDIIAIKQDLEDLLGCKVDVVTEKSLSPYIQQHVLQEAVNL